MENETNEQAYQRLTNEFNILRKRIDSDRGVSLQVKARLLEQLNGISDLRSEALSKFSKEVTSLILKP